MQDLIRNQLRAGSLQIGSLILGGLALTAALGACSNDPIVYPNRNLRPATGGATSEGGAAGEAGEMSSDNGGAMSGGSGGAKGGHGGAGGKGGSGGAAGGGGAPMVGPVCGDGKTEAPEECDDGNTRSGDGCSWDCKTACEICEQNVCPTIDDFYPPDISSASAYKDCYQGTEKIKTGPAAGYPRSEVCQELVDCIRQEDGCAQTRAAALFVQRCWCDSDWTVPKRPDGSSVATACTTDPDPNNPTDPKRFIAGKCASLFQDASEGPALKDVTARLVAPERAEGKALRLLTTCDARECAEECLPTYFNKGGIATIKADIVYERNAAGESALGDLVADSQRAVADADFAFVAAQFIQADEHSPDLKFAPSEFRAADAPGRVLWSEALRVSFGHGRYDFLGQSTNVQANNDLYKATFTGQQIYDALNQQFNPVAAGMLYVSGLRYQWDASQPINSRVVSVFKADSQTPLDKSANYTVAVSSFLTDPQNGPIPALANGTGATKLPNVLISELLGEYLKQLPQPVSPPELNRITRLN